MKSLLKSVAAAAVMIGFASQVRADEEPTLPEGYIRLLRVGPAWVLHQYIDTGYTPLSTDRLEMKVQFENSDRGAAALWCSRKDKISDAVGYGDAIGLVWEGAGTGRLYVDCGNTESGRRTVTDFNPVHDGEYEFVEDCKQRKFYINGVEKVSDLGSVDFAKGGSTLVLFAAWSGQNGAIKNLSYSTYKMSSFKVYGEDDELKLNLVPAFEVATGIAGLYDTVGKYRGDAAPFIKCKVTDATKSECLAFVGGDAFGGELPPNFTLLKSVSPTGQQAVNTLIRPLATDTIEMDVEPVNLGATYCFWCARGTTNPNGSMLFSFNDNKTYTVDRGSASARFTVSATDFTLGTNTLLKIDYEHGKFWANETLKKDGLGNVNFTQGGSDLWLFVGVTGNDRRGASPGNYCNGNYRMRSMKVTGADGTVKLNLVPAMENASKIAGLFDTVQGRFLAADIVDQKPSMDYEEFDKETTYTPMDWIKAPGTQWLNADYTPVSTDTIEMKLRFTEGVTDHSAALWCARAEKTVVGGSLCVCSFLDEINGSYDVSSLTADRDERTVMAFSPNTETDYTFVSDLNNSIFTVNGALLSHLSTYTKSFTASGKLSLFAAHTAGTGLNFLTAMTVPSRGRYRVYSFKVMAPDGTAKIDLRPAVRDHDGTIGMFDYARDKFFTFVGDGVVAGMDEPNRWTVQPTVSPLAWTAGDAAAGKVTLGAALKGTVTCNYTDAELAALEPGSHEVVFSVVDVEVGEELAKTMTVTVAEPPAPPPVYPPAPFAMTGFSRRTGKEKMSFGASAEARQVYLAWSAKDAGVRFTDYTTNVCKLCDIPAAATSAEATVPAETLARIMDGGFRLFLSGAKPTSSDYAAMDDLVVQYDGIDNAGRGVHADRPSVWKNLASDTEGLDFALENADLVYSDRVRLINLTRMTEGAVFDGYTNMTVEVDALPLWFWDNGGAPRVLAGVTAIGKFWLDPTRGGLNFTHRQVEDGKLFEQCYNSKLGTLGQMISKKTYQTYAAIPRLGTAPDVSPVYENGVPAVARTSAQDVWSTDDSTTDYRLALGYSMIICSMHAVRVYGCELSESDIRWNARVDAERFRGADRLCHAEVTGFRKLNGGTMLLVR